MNVCIAATPSANLAEVIAQLEKLGYTLTSTWENIPVSAETRFVIDNPLAFAYAAHPFMSCLLFGSFEEIAQHAAPEPENEFERIYSLSCRNAALFDMAVPCAERSPKELAAAIAERAEQMERSSKLGTIAPFREEHFFLSNYFEVPEGILFDNLTYTSSEAIYQSLKTRDMELRSHIASLSPDDSKNFVHEGMEIRSDWAAIMRDAMKAALMTKFSQRPELRERLLATEGHYLIEKNTWHDGLWGQCVCDECQAQPKVNLLGKTLMEVREALAGACER